MTLPSADTLVHYPDGDLSSRGTVLHVEPVGDGRCAVILDRTACHPVDTAWPDQPADRGVLQTGGTTLTIVDAVTGGIHEGRLHVGEHLPVRMGMPDWTYVVAHIVSAPAPAVGSEVEVRVDEGYRAALSAGHTACHLASLALDDALADAWSKPVADDARGRPAFDSLAIQASRITPHGAVDTYRIGKSLRRKGFAPAALDDLAAVAARTNALLDSWVRAGGHVRIERDDEALSARRQWVAALPDGAAALPCGGTHVADIAMLGSVTVTLETSAVEGGVELVMTTTTAPM